MDPQHPLTYFDKVFIINLPSRVDRRREMTRELKRVGLRIDCPLITLFPAIRPSDCGAFESIGARGAFMSHLAVLRLALKEKYERILILEDDVNFIENFTAHMQRTSQCLSEKTWQIFYGSYQLVKPDALTPGTPCIEPAEGVMLAHFIAFQCRAISMAVAFLETLLTRPAGDPRGGPMHVDGAYSWLRRLNPSLTTRLAVPQLGHQRSSRSDIHKLRWFDRLLGVRSMAAFARSITNTMHRR